MVAKILNYKPTQLFLSTLIIFGALICIFTPSYFLFKIGATFAVQIMIGYLLMGLIFLMLRQPKLMFTSFACCAGLCIFLKFSSNAELAVPLQTSDDIIKIAHFNLTATDEDVTGTIEQILRPNADLISIQEVTPDWDDILKESLKETYPYAFSISRADPFGIAIYSKLPITDMDTFYYEDIPNLSGIIRSKNDKEEIRFICSHTTPPLYNVAYERMKNHLKIIADYANQIKTPIITLGEFNAPPWWAEIHDLKEAANLQDSRRSAAYGFADIFKMPVDYIFHSKELTCINFRPIYTKASGHMGIIGSYQFNSDSYVAKEN